LRDIEQAQVAMQRKIEVQATRIGDVDCRAETVRYALNTHAKHLNGDTSFLSSKGRKPEA
jgi:hypothetical protein